MCQVVTVSWLTDCFSSSTNIFDQQNVTRAPCPALNVVPDIIPSPCPVDAMEDNASTPAARTAMQEVDQGVINMSGYSMDMGTLSYYIHQPYSTNNVQSNIQSSQTCVCLLAPIPTVPLGSLHLMLTCPIKVTALLRCLHPPEPLSQTISTWNQCSCLLLQLVFKRR